MISTEQAFDILPYVADIYEKLDVQQYVLDRQVKVKEGEDAELKMMGFGLDLFSYVFKRSSAVKDEVFSIVAILESKDVAEVRQQSIVKTMQTLRGIFESRDAVDFFTSAMQ